MVMVETEVYGFKSFDNIEEIIQTVRKTIWNYNENITDTRIQLNMSIYENIL